MDNLRTTFNPATLALMVSMTIAATGQGFAQSAKQSPGVDQFGVERIEAGDQLRMLTQQISASACLVDAGIEVDAHKAAIKEGIADFDAILAAMRDGDTAYGIQTPETNRKMLAAIRGLSLQWDLLKVSAEQRVNGDASGEVVDYLSRQNINTMHAAKYLVTETVNTYAVPPALLQNDAFTLYILVRQRTLAQQIAKELCGLTSGNVAMGTEARLRNSTRLFDVSLGALLNGFPSAGVAPPETDDSRRSIEEISVEWSDISGQLIGVAQKGDMQAATGLIQRLDQLLTPLDQLVATYAAESRSGI